MSELNQTEPCPTVLRKATHALMLHNAHVMPWHRAQWAEAMRGEAAHIENDFAALTWAAGCVLAGYWERLTSRAPQVATADSILKGNSMNSQQVNRISGFAVLALSLTALLPVAIPFAKMLLGHPPVHSRDEGAAAHLFQLSVVLFGLSLLLFLVTSDWHQPKTHILHRVAFPIAALGLAFAGVFFMHL